MQKGLRLMGICTGIFAPSQEFLPFLEQYVDEIVMNNTHTELGCLQSSP